MNARKISDRLETIKLLHLDHDESKFEILKDVAKLKEQDAVAHQRYIDVREKYESARIKAQEAQRLSKEVKKLVDESRELTLEEGRLRDQYRSNLTTYSDRIRSIRERAKNLPRNAQ